MSVVNIYNLFLNSATRSSGTSPSPTWNFNNKPISLQNPSENWFTLYVDSATIPFSFDIINYNYNTMTGNSINGIPFTYIIPEGNYDIITLINLISALIQQQMNTLVVGNNYIIYGTFDVNTLSMTWFLTDSGNTAILI